jgi:cytochrome c biogenesis protein CcmG/thiol:disulfide interchange protein DsbE
MGEQTWAGAAREVWRSAIRHKVISGVVALCVVGSLIGIARAGGSSSAAGSSGAAGGVSGPGGQAPAFSLPLLGNSGQKVSLADYAGKPLIVNFFASWCAPCKTETPLLAKFYRSEHGRVALVGLDENDVTANATSFTRADGVSYPVGWDPQVTVASAYGVSGLPQTFFLDARHRVVDRIFGAVTEAALQKGIALATGGTSG